MRRPTLAFDHLEDRTVPATFTVTSLLDSGPGSLRDAVEQANAASGADEIQFTAGLTGTIVLTSGELQIDDSVSIEGPGADKVTVSGNNASRVIEINAPGSPRMLVSISGLTLANGNGNATSVGLTDGGALLATGTATVSLSNMIVRDSVGNDGGGIAAHGTDLDLFISYSQILNNQCVGTLADGGGVTVSGREFRFVYSTADGNVSSDSGGGLSIQTDTGLVDSSTISNNIASAGGGGGLVAGLINTTTITNSTIADNHANGGFSGAGVLAFDVMSINNSTIVRNIEDSEGGTAGVNAFIGSDVTILSSLIAENNVPGAPTFFSMDVGGDVTSLGNNFIGDTRGSGKTAWLSTDILDKPSHLPQLADNGGPTKTILPDGASFANGNGANPLALQFDQRGPGFPWGATIGAVNSGRARVFGGGLNSNSSVRGTVEEGHPRVNGYIRALYATILGREADPIGLELYTQRLLNGESRESIAGEIWNSVEHRQREIAGFYQQFLHRDGTTSEINSYVMAMLDGASEEDVIISFLSSDEYRARFATTDLYVAQLYQDTLGRPADPTGASAYTTLLNFGTSREDVARSLVTSLEGRRYQTSTLYGQLLLRSAGAGELAAYNDRFGGDALISELGIEIAASGEMYALGEAFIP